MFWRFLFAMFFSSLIGIELFVVATSLYSERQLNQVLHADNFVAALKQDFVAAAPTLELASSQPALCRSQLQSLSLASSALKTLTDGGPNSLVRMVQTGRLSLRYVVDGQVVCSFPAASVVQQADVLDADPPESLHFSVGAAGVPATLELDLVPLRFVALMWQASKEMPWNMLLLFTAFMNFGCAITLAPILVRRIKRAEIVARGWTEGNMLARIQDSRHDEFGNLVRSFNQLADSFVDVIKVKQELAAFEERNRLARDLHDTAKQRAFALNLQLTALVSLGTSNLAETTRLASSTLSLVHHLQSDLSNVIKRLSASTIAEVGIREVLRQEIAHLFDGSGIHWEIRIPDEVDAVLRETSQLAQQILLIAIEASANVLKHADAQHIVVSLVEDSDEYLLCINDDGKGLVTQQTPSLGMGLTNMRLRARGLPKGGFSIVNQEGGGVTVAVRFQL
jgi:signal transduction histidine kinase